MPAIEIHVRAADAVDADQVFHVARDIFPGETLINYQAGSYHLELDDRRAKYLLDMIEKIPEVQGFIPYVEWEAKHRDQMTLRFGSIANMDDDLDKAAIG